MMWYHSANQLCAFQVLNTDSTVSIAESKLHMKRKKGRNTDDCVKSLKNWQGGRKEKIRNKRCCAKMKSGQWKQTNGWTLGFARCNLLISKIMRTWKSSLYVLILALFNWVRFLRYEESSPVHLDHVSVYALNRGSFLPSYYNQN